MPLHILRNENHILRNEKPWKHCGAVYGQSKDEETLNVLIKDFEKLQYKPGEFIMSPNLKTTSTDGRPWYVFVYPYGDDHPESNNEESVDVFLGVRNVKKQFKISLVFKLGPTLSLERNDATVFRGNKTIYAHGFRCRRKTVLSECLNDDGSLNISINIRVHEDENHCWYPVLNIPDRFNAINLLQNSDEADVAMSIGKEKDKFYLHKCILSLRAPGLYRLAKDVPQGEEIEFPETTRFVFENLIHYIYGSILPFVEKYDAMGSILPTDGKNDAMELLDLANKFGCTLLKLQLESEITSKVVNAGNAADWLLVADGKICPLLKEKCISICKESFEKVKASPGWKSIRESPDLMEEVIEHLSTDTTNDSSNHNKDIDEVDRMDVGTLRNLLQPYGLDMQDGTKKMLIQRVKENLRKVEEETVAKS